MMYRILIHLVGVAIILPARWLSKRIRRISGVSSLNP